MLAMVQGNLATVDAHENWPFFGVDRNRVLRSTNFASRWLAGVARHNNRVNIAWKFAPTSFLILLTTLLLYPGTALAQAQPGYLPEFACLTPPFGLRLPPHLPDLMRIAPVSDTEILEVEKWNTYTTTRRYVHFPGLTLGLVTFSNDPKRYMVSLAKITDTQWAEISPFQVDETTTSVRRRIGPSAAGDPDLEFDYGSEGGDLRFENLDGIITKIIYRCYTG